MRTPMKFASIEDAIHDLILGKVIIVVDDASFENRGDFIALADKATPEIINFMIKEGRGLVCMPITEERAFELELPLMVANNKDKHRSAFTVSVDHISTTTGISAYERSQTVQEMINPNAIAAHFRRPGHLFPIVAVKGGVIRRSGHTEAAIDLAAICGVYPAAIICDVIKQDGHMAQIPDLQEIAEKHNLSMISIRALIQYRTRKEVLIKRAVEVELPTDHGVFQAIAYTNEINDKEHIALVKGKFDPLEPVLVRVHTECLTGDAFHSARCECGNKLETALKMINDNGRGVLLYLRQEECGISLVDKLKDYARLEQRLAIEDVHIQAELSPSLEDYGIGAQILKDLGIRRMRLMTNNSRKIMALNGFGLEVIERIALHAEDKDETIAI